jgi:hypothetical protein
LFFAPNTSLERTAKGYSVQSYLRGNGCRTLGTGGGLPITRLLETAR